MIEHKHHWTWDTYEIRTSEGETVDGIEGMLCACGERLNVDQVQDIVNKVEAERGTLRVQVEMALQCAKGRLADMPKLPCRVDQMTEREVKIMEVASHCVGALKFIRDTLNSGDSVEPIPG